MFKIHRAKLINEKLGVDIYNESFDEELILIRYTEKEIKALCIDDLVIRSSSGFMYPTSKLIEMGCEIQLNENEERDDD